MVGVKSVFGFGAEEANSATGDPGGPTFIDGVITGVITFGGRLPATDVTDTLDSSWGEASFDTRVSMFRDFITSATGGAAVFVTGSPHPGDYNGRGIVEQVDLELVLMNWGDELFNPFAAGWINHLPSGLIDQEELDKVLVNWGSSVDALGAAAAVPEPTALSLALIVTCLAYRLCRPSAPLRVRLLAGGVRPA